MLVGSSARGEQSYGVNRAYLILNKAAARHPPKFPIFISQIDKQRIIPLMTTKFWVADEQRLHVCFNRVGKNAAAIANPTTKKENGW